MINWKKAREAQTKRDEEAEQELSKEGERELVLVVDDEETNRKMLQRMLSTHYDVITAENGKDALDKLQTPNISVIIADQRMPEMTGIEFCEAAEHQQHPAPRIILTGFAELTDVIDAINKANIFRFLTKPVEKAHLGVA